MTFANTHATLEIAANGVGELVIERAGRLNILNTPVMQDLLQAFAKARENPDLKVLVVRGASGRAFIAGADIKEMAALDKESATEFIDHLRRLCEAPRSLPMPVIARIPGWALGGGLEFALSCDLRVASDNAQFGMPEVKVGIPSIIHAALIPRLVGQARANWLLLTGEVIDAQRALAWGLVDEVVTPERLDDATSALANGLAALGPAVLAQQKRLLRQWQDEPLERSIKDGVYEFASAFDTGEPQKYMQAFIDEKAARDNHAS